MQSYLTMSYFRYILKQNKTKQNYHNFVSGTDRNKQWSLHIYHGMFAYLKFLSYIIAESTQ